MKHLNLFIYLLVFTFGLLLPETGSGQIVMPAGNGSRRDTVLANTTVTDNGGPLNPYNPLSASSLTLVPTAGNVISISFTEFDFEPSLDFLYIFDGPNSSYPMIMCGATGSTLPANVTGTNKDGLTIVLISDGNVEGQGFKADVSLVAGGTPADESKKSVPYSGEVRMRSCAGSVYDNGGPTCNYMIGAGIVDSDGYLIIEPDLPDHVVRLDFSMFDVEQVPNVSPPDYLIIYDGSDTLSPVIGEFGTNPGIITADAGNFNNSSGTLTLKFNSDFLFELGGFEAALSCIPRPKVEAVTPDTTICFGDTAKINVRFTAGTAPFSLVYETILGRITVTDIPTNTYTVKLPKLPVGNQTFTIRQVGDVNLKLRDATGPNLARIITVKAPPTAAFATPVSEVCNGNPANLRVNLTGTPPFSLTYTIGVNSFTQNNINTNFFVITFSPTQTSIVRLTSVKDATCNGVISGGMAVVTVTPKPEVTFGTGSTGNVCPGSSKALTLNFVGKGPWTVTYNDGVSDHTINNISANPYIFNVTVSRPTVFTLVSVTTANCPPGIANGSATVGFYTPPVATAQPSIDCGTGMGIITATATAGKTPYFYSFDGGLAFGTQNTAARPLSDLPYTVVVMDANGCKDTATVLLNGIPAPTITTIDNFTQSSMRVAWTMSNSPGARYTLKYRVKGSEGAWTTVSNLLVNNRTLVGLQAGTEYEFEVAVSCANGVSSPWSEKAYGKTLDAVPAACTNTVAPVPTGFYINQIQARSARLNWNSVSGPGYIVSFGLASQNPNSWAQFMVCNTNPMTPTSYMVATNLQPNSLYRARIRTNCTNCTSAIQIADRRSNWSYTIEWRTPNARDEIQSDIFSGAEFSLYPNPNKGQFSFTARVTETGQGNIEILDLTGKVIYHKEVLFSETEETHPIDLTNVASGIYLLKCEYAGTVRHFKVMIE